MFKASKNMAKDFLGIAIEKTKRIQLSLYYKAGSFLCTDFIIKFGNEFVSHGTLEFLLLKHQLIEIHNSL